MDFIVGLLTNKYFVGIASPVALLILGALGKGVINREHSIRNWYLGFDASLTSLYTGMAYLYDLAHDSSPDVSKKLGLTATYLILCLVLFLVVLACHQSWEANHKESEDDQNPWAQFLMLGIFANFLGFGLLLVFILIVKGVNQ